MTNWQEVFSETFTEDQEDLQRLLSNYGDEGLCEYLSDNPNVFHEICQAGFLEVAKILLNHGADINTEWGGMTPLQQAAASGDLELVKFLLSQGADVSRDVWMDTSPFYLASRYGHFDVVVELTKNYPSYVKEPESRSSLFYAACKGGNLKIVKFWYLPGMDINSPVQLISSFENCENMVPLYAACESNQLDVARFLVDNAEATITAWICEQFPEITSELVKGCFQLDVNEMYTARLSGGRLGLVSTMWFEPYKALLTTLDLSDNRLKALPSVIPWGLPHLNILNVSNNRLQVLDGSGELPGLCDDLETVDLSNNLLEEVCADLFCLPSLTSLDLSNNKLQYLIRPTHVQPELNWSGQARERKISSGNTDCEWSLPSLTHLHIHGNNLVRIPEELRTCQALKHLDASDNELYSFISPWNCPLHFLNLSDNFLERFPVSVEEFWSGSLYALYLQNNQLEDIGESIVKLSELRSLDLSNNKIDRLPDPAVWDCRYLEALNLANNCMGQPVPEDPVSPRNLKDLIRNRRRSVLDQDKVKVLEFPKLLSLCLKYLYLRNNNLDQVPISVCKLQNLCLLDISQNPLIKTLPRELGLLTQCRDLVLSGTNIKDAGIPDRLLTDSVTSELLEHLRQLLRKCESNNRVKLVVLGPQDKGKSTLLNLLQGISGSNYHHGTKIRTTEWKLTARNAYQMLLPSSKPDVLFNVWELPGHPDLNIIHQCFLTQNALYLLVFDLRKDYQHLQEWLCQIQANAPKANVILVGTFFDKLDPSSREMKLKEMSQNIMRAYSNQRVKEHYPSIRFYKPVSCATKEGISELKKIIYESAASMQNAHYRSETFLGFKIPQSYRLLAEKVMRKKTELGKLHQPPILTEEGFYSLLKELPDNEVIALDDVNNALQYLLEVGCFLHFNEQLTGLNCLYFLNPIWLQELLSLIALTDKIMIVSTAKIPVSMIQKRYKDKEFPNYLFPQFMQLLRRFEIAMETDNDKSLLVPSKLPKEQPMIAADLIKKAQSRKIYRLYKLTYIPPGLWSRLIIRLLKATERFSQTPWFLNKLTKRESLDRSRLSSSRGLAIKNKDITYWREGIRVAHETGYFLVESVNYHIPECEDLGIGILITIVSQDHRGLSAMGVIVDELDDILRDYFPCFQDFVDHLPMVHAVCPQCFDQVKDESGIVVHIDHFDVQTCALTILNKGDITCPRGMKVPLEDLVPEMLFKELPKRFFLDSSQMTISDKSLGRGAAGTVFPGKFGETDVAIKMFHCMVKRPVPSGPNSVDSGSASMSTGSSQDTPVYGNFSSGQSSIDEANSLKAYKAFSEVRKEVAVLSKLRHPCIVSFLGLSVHPHLYIAMELAKLGSLRSVLEKEMANRTFNKFMDKHKTFSSVLGKDLNFKIIYQVAKGLQYLHEHSITYRDLKSDNVLVCSLDVTSTLNVKLSDYGISKFSTTQGLSGFVGTPGYMAPEVLSRQTYTEKVDIFSFSMLIYEVLCGHLAYEEYQNLIQIIQAAVNERKRPALKNFCIVSHFPYLEYLMSVCWDHDASKRPSSTDITKYMRHHQFVCQHEVLSIPDTGPLFSDVTCTAILSETDRTERKPQMWIWEANGDSQRRYSIYNLDTSSFHVLHNACPGADARCMLKVDKYIWVGTDDKEIEVFGCHSVGVPQCRERWSLTAIPTVIVFYKQSDNEEEQMGHVFVGLVNGTVAIFSHQPNMRKLSKTWKLAKTLTLSEQSVTGMTLVCQRRELWVGCGHTIAIVSTQTLLKEDSIDLKKENISKKLVKNLQIQQLVCAGDMVWCSFRNSSKILEYNGELRQVMYCLDIKNDNLKCKYLGDAKTDKDDNDSDVKTDTDEETTEGDSSSSSSVSPTVLMRSTHGRSVVDDGHRASKNEDTNDKYYLTVLEDDPEQHYEEPISEGGSSASERNSQLYEVVEVGRQLSNEGNEIRTVNIKQDELSKSPVNSLEANIDKRAPLPPPRPPKYTGKSDVKGDSAAGGGLPARPPRITVTGESSVNKVGTLPPAEAAPPVPHRTVTVTDGTKPDVPPAIPPRTNTLKTLTVPSKEKKNIKHYDNFMGKSDNEEKPPVPPRRLTITTPPHVPKRSQSKSPIRPRHNTMGIGSSIEDPPALPPRPKSAFHDSRRYNPHQQTGDASQDPLGDFSGRESASAGTAQCKQVKQKRVVSSMLAVEDTLWIGTSSGNIVVVGFKGDQPDYPRPKLSALESVSGVRLDKGQGKSGPVHILTAAGSLVVSSTRVTTKSQDVETELTAWEASGSERFGTIRQFWQSLHREEKELSQKNSMDFNI